MDALFGRFTPFNSCAMIPLVMMLRLLALPLAIVFLSASTVAYEHSASHSHEGRCSICALAQTPCHAPLTTPPAAPHFEAVEWACVSYACRPAGLLEQAHSGRSPPLLFRQPAS